MSSILRTTFGFTRKFSFYSTLFLLLLTLLTFYVVWNGDLTLEIELDDGFVLNPYLATVLFYLLLQTLISLLVFALAFPIVYLWTSWRGAQAQDLSSNSDNNSEPIHD